jgi:hypothetical protein
VQNLKVKDGLVIVLRALAFAIISTRFVSLNADEVISVDNMQWLAMHVYVVQDNKRVPFLLHKFHANQRCKFDMLVAH